MERNDVFKRYSIIEKIDFEKYETYIVYDRLYERNKRLTFLIENDLKKCSISKLTDLFCLFSNQNIKSMEYLFDWGILQDGAIYFVRDARSLMKIKQHSFLLEDLRVMILDILIALFNIHRNGLYYGKVHQNSIYYCFNRYNDQRKIHYVLSALSDNMKFGDNEIEKAQKWDIMSFGITVLRILSKDDIDILLYEENHEKVFENLSEYNIEEDLKDIILGLIDSKHDALYFIKKILDKEEQSKYPELHAIYNEFLFSRFPKRHIPVKNIQNLDDLSNTLFFIEGQEGSGKTEVLNIQSQKLRKKGYALFRMDALSEICTRIGMHNNIFSYIQSYFPGEDLTATRDIPNDIKHHLFYALSVMKEKIKPIILVDDIEYADKELESLIKMFLQSGIPVFITQKFANDHQGYDFIKSLNNIQQVFISLEKWDKDQIENILSISFPFYSDDIKEYILKKLCSYNIDNPKDIMRIIFQINMQIGLSEFDSGKLLRIITNIISKNLVKRPFYKDLSNIQKDILLILYLYPCDIKRLSIIQKTENHLVLENIESLMREGYIIEKNNIFMINKEFISNNILLNEKKKNVQSIHKKIADYLIADAKKTKKYSPLLIAEHLFNAGEKSDSAAFYFNAALNFEKNYNFDQAIKYYKISLSIYKGFKKKVSREKLKKIYISLFDLYIKRGNLSNALQCLKSMQASGIKDYDYYTRYSFYYRQKADYKKSINYINKAKDIAIRNNDKIQRASIQTDLIKILIEVGKYEKAYNLINEALAYQKENGILEQRGYLLNLLSLVYLQFGSYQKAEKCLLEATEIEKNSKNYLVLPLIYNNLGIINIDKGNFKKALVYYNNALDISLKVNDIIGISREYHNIGALYKIIGDFIEAESYFMKSKIYHERANLKYGKSKDLQQLGNLYTLKGELNRAFSLLKESMRSSISILDKDGAAESLEYLGILYFFLGSYQEAIQSLKEATERAQKTKNIRIMNSVNMNLSLIYLDLGDFTSSMLHARLALDDLKSLQIIRDYYINHAIVDICKNYINLQKDHQLNYADLDIPSNILERDGQMGYIESIKLLISKEVSPVSRFRMMKLYLDCLISIYYSYIKPHNQDETDTLSAEFIKGIIDITDTMKYINIIETSKYYNLYYNFYERFAQIAIKKDIKFIANILNSSIDSLKTCIDKDYSELIWRWEYIVALSYYTFENNEKAKEHFANILSRLENNSENLNEPYSDHYINAPFRKAIYDLSRRHLDMLSI